MSQIDPTIMYYHFLLFSIMFYIFTYFTYMLMEKSIILNALISSNQEKLDFNIVSQDECTYKTILK